MLMFGLPSGLLCPWQCLWKRLKLRVAMQQEGFPTTLASPWPILDWWVPGSIRMSTRGASKPISTQLYLKAFAWFSQSRVDCVARFGAALRGSSRLLSPSRKDLTHTACFCLASVTWQLGRVVELNLVTRSTRVKYKSRMSACSASLI